MRVAIIVSETADVSPAIIVIYYIDVRLEGVEVYSVRSGVVLYSEYLSFDFFVPCK